MMATPIERLQALGNALIDGVVTPAALARVANAYVAHFRNDVIALGLDPDNLTNQQKAVLVLRAHKDYTRDLVRLHDEAVAAAKDDLVAAGELAAATAADEWPEE